MMMIMTAPPVLAEAPPPPPPPPPPRRCSVGLLGLLLLVVTWAPLLLAHDACRFPSAWSGHWFHSGVQQFIVINQATFSFKGTCVESGGDKFLLEDREGCFRCVVIHEKHSNILQYKETDCDPRESLEATCSKINGDAPLFTMFRVNGTPETCPFGGPFTFTYNRGQQSSDCHDPLSSVDSCTEDHRLLLRYQACPDVSGTESTAEELVCLGTWKEGSTRFLVGKLEHKTASTSEDKYRCFIYEELDDETGFSVAQSGDATCIGFFSINEGSRILTLTRATPPYSACEFPDWLTGYPTWHTLDHRKVYTFDLTTNATFNVTDANPATPHMQVSCVDSKPSGERRVLMILHATVGCHSGYTCATFYKRKDHVIEFQKGSMVHHIEDACQQQHFDETTAEFVTLLTDSPKPGNCPRLGKYNVVGMHQRPPSSLLLTKAISSAAASSTTTTTTTTTTMRTMLASSLSSAAAAAFQAASQPSSSSTRDPCRAVTEVHIGCSGHDLIEFHADCPAVEHKHPPQTYQCHGSWQENGTSYLITSLKGTKSRFCFIYVESDNVVKISGVRETCSRGVQPGITGFMALNVTNEGKCGDVSGTVAVSCNTGSLVWTLLLLLTLHRCYRVQ